MLHGYAVPRKDRQVAQIEINLEAENCYNMTPNFHTQGTFVHVFMYTQEIFRDKDVS